MYLRTFRLTEAKRSIFGVIANESPYAPNAGRKSSTTINNTFGDTYGSGITWNPAGPEKWVDEPKFLVTFIDDLMLTFQTRGAQPFISFKAGINGGFAFSRYVP